MNNKTNGTSDAARERKPLSLSTKILIGMVAGIGCGLFFGEYCSWLNVVGDGFVDLLQMTVLPYVTLSLVLNIGRLSPAQAKRLAGIAGVVLLVLWALAGLVVVTAPFALPPVETGSFFTASLLQDPETFDLISMYIPANPFYALANNIVPAVVLFSIFVGVALIGIERKQPLMDLFEVLLAALTQVNSFVIRLTPYGMFAIAAGAAGTLTFAELSRLEAYFVVYLVTAVVLTFWILPLLVAAVTPFSYRQVVGASRDAVMTALATGKLFVTLPLLIRAAEKLFQEIDEENEATTGQVDLLVPLAYPFPSIGKLLALLFIPFSAWFVGSTLGPGQLAILVGTGLMSLFGSPVAAIPYLLDLFRLPADMFNLFLVSGIFATRLSDVVGAMHILAFTLIVTCATAGLLKINKKRMVTGAMSTFAIVAVTIVAVRAHIGYLESQRERPDILGQMELLVEPAPHVVLEEPAPNPCPLELGESRLERGKRCRTVRVGFNSGELPFAYFNDYGDLVGFDIELAHRLALELDAELTFVPFEFDTLAEQLEADHFDVAMSGITAGYDRLEALQYANGPLDLTGSLLVPDYRREDFASASAVRKLGPLKMAVLGTPRVSERFSTRAPNVELVPVESHAEFFDRHRDNLEGMVTVAEIGAAWTLRYPGFQVVVPEGVEVKAQLIYPVSWEADDVRTYINRWVEIVEDDGTSEELYRYWILGEGAVETGPRWSVIRDVLRWVD